MSEAKLRIIGTRSVSKRGGSLQVTIPEIVTQFLDLKKGDKLAFIIDTKKNCVIIGKPETETMRVTFSTFGEAKFGLSLSKDLIEKILKSDQRRNTFGDINSQKKQTPKKHHKTEE